ncbi:Mn2+/Fe2+ transporter [Natronorubrum sp. A-ect3]|uniref:Mn2+/Fe2+ transporter n=1 Tax=Natronorubrum sp. A-ect3 TaxID=3242698 RepID=UPI00359DE963
MGEQQEIALSNPPIKNVLVVSAIVLVATVVGSWGVSATDSLGTVVTWIWIGIGLAALYLLYDIANSVKELNYNS